MAQSIQSLFPKLEVFNFLLPEDYDVIESYMFRYQYEADKYVFKQGTHGGYMFFIVEGEVEVSQMLDNKKVIVANLGPGRSLGEMSLLDGNTRSATVKATSKLTLIVLKREDFNRLLDEHPTTANRVVIGIASLLSRSLRATTHGFSEKSLSLC